MGWLTSIGAIAELVLQVVAIFKKREVQALGEQLRNAKTVDEKQKAAQAISAHLYS